MGFGSYFKTSTKKAAETRSDAVVVDNEKDADSFPRTSEGPYTPPSGLTSRAESITSTDSRGVEQIKHQVILNFLWQKQRGLGWTLDTTGTREGVMIRKTRQEYIYRPAQLASSHFAAAMSMLNVQAAMTVNSSIIEPFLLLNPDARDVPLNNGLRIQVLDDLDSLPRARRHQYAAFVKSEGLLIVWEDDPTLLFDRAKNIEDGLLQTVWKPVVSDDNEKKKATDVAVLEVDCEGQVIGEERRKHWYTAFLAGCSVAFLIGLLGLGWGLMALEIVVLNNWIILAYLIMIPITSFLAFFFCSTFMSILFQFFGPVKQLAQNSHFYSAKPPPRILTSILPHVTIQMPVYKEGLAAVIVPTITSVKKAISTYELQGGSANIFINDDGLQLIPEAERQARIDFYADNGIGWTARPGHNVDGFIRKGKFKKASNMNYGIALSNAVEEKLQNIERSNMWTQVDEVNAFDECLNEVLEENPRAWAEGNIRIGDYILIIDSDTEVPVDCLLDAAGEMEQWPEVGIIQFSCGVMQVSHNFFENGITFFTNLVYTAIRYAVANGTVAAFVGHNAILRWSAVQEAAFLDGDGIERFWSEDCVSEDFDMALRLQMKGYTIRMSGYFGEDFKEGVSLTVYDELARWQKYAYGCNELIFHPLRYWFTKGPFTPLFRQFCRSPIDVGSKLGIVAYIGTYYAIGSAWLVTIVNYVMVGLYEGYLDKVYLQSWEVLLSIWVVFTVAGNVGLAVMRHRSGEKAFIPALLENFTWCLMFAIFFGGLSLHLAQALLCHLFSIDISWGATNKEVEDSNFWLEVPKILKGFKYTFAIMFLLIAVMIVMAVGTFIPWSWNITSVPAIVPLAIVAGSHILLPIVLNPDLMKFSF